MTQFLQATSNGLYLGSIYTLLGLGFVIVFKATGVVSFTHPVLMVFGGYFVSYLAFTSGWPFWLALIAAIAATVALSSIIERAAMRPMVGQPAFSAVMVTVGLFIALKVVVDDLIGVNRRLMGDPWGLGSVDLGGVVVFQRNIAAVIIAAVVVTALLAFFKYSRVGLAMRATAFDQEVALAQGVAAGRMFNLSWAISGGLAALAGLFAGTGDIGIDQSTAFVALKALPAIILGGLDSIGGAVVGGIIIGLVEAYTGTYQPEYATWLGPNFSQVMPYVVMLIVLLVRPYGLWGTIEIERV